MIRFAGIFAALGIAISLLLIATWKISSAAGLSRMRRGVADLMLVLWPASLNLMGLQGGSTTSEIVVTYTILILVNGALYGLVGLIIGMLLKVARRLS